MKLVTYSPAAGGTPAPRPRRSTATASSTSPPTWPPRRAWTSPRCWASSAAATPAREGARRPGGKAAGGHGCHDGGEAARAHPAPGEERLLRGLELPRALRGRRQEAAGQPRAAAVAGLLQQGAHRRHRPVRRGALRRVDLHLARLGGGAGRGDRPRRQEHQGRGRDEARLGLHGDQRRVVARPAAPPRRPVAQGQEPRRHLPHGPGAGDRRQPRPRQPARDLPRERRHQAGLEHEVPLLQAAAPHPATSRWA